MRRTGKIEEVHKCSFKHTCKTPSWRVAGMTEMTRAAGLSCGADKRQRARASPWNCTGETSQAPSYSPVWDGFWEVGPGRTHHYLILQGQSCPMSPVTWERCMHSGGQSVHPKAPSFHYCQVEEAKLALLCGARMQLRGCAYIFLSYANWHSKQSQHGRKR